MEKLDKEKVFIQNKIYPNAVDIFNTKILPIEKIVDKCIYVIDTNALLIPYTTSSTSFNEIKKTYSKLIKQGKLIIPGQVAREFAKNRPEKIKSLYQQIARTRSTIQNPQTKASPLLEELKEYKEVISQEKKVKEVNKIYSEKVGLLLEKIKSWRWNDPISEAYNKLFSPNTIYDPSIDEDKILEELQFRNKHSIPPGFKDKSKEDGGVGDLLIWLSILDIAEEKKSHIVFISGDEKTDWFHRMEKEALYPRYELITEFQSKTESKSFHIIRLSELLSLQGVSDKVIQEVKFKEKIILDNPTKNVNHSQVYDKVLDWLKNANKESEIIEYLDGIPEIVIVHSDHREGVEVKFFSNPNMLKYRISKLTNEAMKLIMNNQINEFTGVLIAAKKEHVYHLHRTVLAFKQENKNEFISFIGGFLDENNQLEFTFNV